MNMEQNGVLLLGGKKKGCGTCPGEHWLWGFPLFWTQPLHFCWEDLSVFELCPFCVCSVRRPELRSNCHWWQATAHICFTAVEIQGGHDSLPLALHLAWRFVTPLICSWTRLVMNSKRRMVFMSCAKHQDAFWVLEREHSCTFHKLKEILKWWSSAGGRKCDLKYLLVLSKVQKLKCLLQFWVIQIYFMLRLFRKALQL